MVLDVGSNLGYFGLRASQYRDGLAVVSIESDEIIANRQSEILAAHAATRVCLIHGAINSGVSREWVETCDWFDVTLLLSILHWFDDPAAVVSDISRMSGHIIAEVPDPLDKTACGQDKIQEWAQPLEWFRKVTGRQCSLLGRVPRHTSEHHSHMILVSGPVSRVPTRPYWRSQFSHPEGNDYRLTYDGTRIELIIRGRTADYIPGVNLLSLMKLGQLVWPRPPHWIRAGRAAMSGHPNHRDPLMHNMLWTPHGIDMIDAHDLRGNVQGRDALRMFKKNIRAWRRNRTAGSAAYVPNLPAWRLRLRQWRRRFSRAVEIIRSAGRSGASRSRCGHDREECETRNLNKS